jgi:hypothetical protein
MEVTSCSAAMATLAKNTIPKNNDIIKQVLLFFIIAGLHGLFRVSAPIRVSHIFGYSTT